MNDRRSKFGWTAWFGMLILAAGMVVAGGAIAAPAPSDAAIKAVAAPASQATLTAPTDVAGAVEEGIRAWELVKGGKYREAIALGIVLLVWAWRRFGSRVIIGWLENRSTWWVGFITVLLGFLTTMPGALLTEPFSCGRFVLESVLCSAEAMLFWQMVLKRIPWFRMAPTVTQVSPAQPPPRPPAA